MTADVCILAGDCLESLRALPACSVHCCVTSPPYWGLRDYGHEGQIGLEETPEAYVARLVEVFREVRRVLRDDGTLWLNLGDSYANIGKSGGSSSGKHARGLHGGHQSSSRAHGGSIAGLKPKDLVGIPWRVAFALQADGWYLRSDIIWAKPNPMPESVTDRPTKAHEYLFLLAKGERYFYDAEAIREPATSSFRGGPTGRGRQPYAVASGFSGNPHQDHSGWLGGDGEHRNRRTVWTIPTQPYPGAHFAVFPPALVEPCIKAGCPVGGTVLDPFAGSGTTLAEALRLGRSAIGCELNPEYVVLIEERLRRTQPALPGVA